MPIPSRLMREYRERAAQRIADAWDTQDAEARSFYEQAEMEEYRDFDPHGYMELNI